MNYRLLFVGGPNHGTYHVVPEHTSVFQVADLQHRHTSVQVTDYEPLGYVVTNYFRNHVQLKAQINEFTGEFDVLRRQVMLHDSVCYEPPDVIDAQVKDAVFHMWMQDEPDVVRHFDRNGYLRSSTP